MNPATSRDIWLLPMEEDATPEPFLKTSFVEGAPAFSPDGRFLAYVNDRTGQPEVWVQALGAEGSAHRVSVDGGFVPAWGPSGQRIYYIDLENRLMSVDITTTPEIRLPNPKKVLDAFDATQGVRWTQHGQAMLRGFDLSPDGSRFVTTSEYEGPDHLCLVTNWFAELRALAPPREER